MLGFAASPIVAASIRVQVLTVETTPHTYNVRMHKEGVLFAVPCICSPRVNFYSSISQEGGRFDGTLRYMKITVI